MRTEQSRSSDELPVLISLVVALGILVALQRVAGSDSI